MTNLWLKQIAAVVRIELKKTFFARRGLWIYLLALAPVVIFLLQAIFTRTFNTGADPSKGPVLTQQQIDSVQDNLTHDQIVARLGPPLRSRRHTERSFDEDGKPVVVEREQLDYMGENERATFQLENGVLKGRFIRSRFTIETAAYAFAGVFQFFFLRLVVFFGCLGIFMNLFRGEMVDKTIHYYLLSPLRREVLLIGKFCAGLIAATVIFTLSAALQWTAALSGFDSNSVSRFFSQDHGASQIAAYLGVTALACVGYGSIFTAAGLLVRNPIVAAVVVLIWEAANPILPAMLKKFSVIYYLKSLCPVQIPVDPGMPQVLRALVTNSDPISPWIAVFGLLALAALVLWVSAFKIRRLEINYTSE